MITLRTLHLTNDADGKYLLWKKKTFKNKKKVQEYLICKVSELSSEMFFSGVNDAVASAFQRDTLLKAAGVRICTCVRVQYSFLPFVCFG